MTALLAPTTRILGHTPAPRHTSPSVHYGEIAGGVLHGLRMGLTASPWIAGLFAAFVLIAGVSAVHSLLYPANNRDSVGTSGRARRHRSDPRDRLQSPAQRTAFAASRPSHHIHHQATCICMD